MLVILCLFAGETEVVTIFAHRLSGDLHGAWNIAGAEHMQMLGM